VAITGASGFIGLHCVLALLRDGYRVRGTLRDLAREASLRQALAKYVEIGDRLGRTGLACLQFLSHLRSLRSLR